MQVSTKYEISCYFLIRNFGNSQKGDGKSYLKGPATVTHVNS